MKNDGKVYYQRILEASKQSFFLFGCRGTGKSTWIRKILPEAFRIDLLNEELYQQYLGNPGLFAGKMRAMENGSIIVIDEVQRLPFLLNEVHRFIEEKNLVFILCGSSSRKLKRAGVNLLAGRALEKHIYPFVPEELKDEYALTEVMKYGSLPVVWTSPDKNETLKAFTRLYLKEEIQAEAIVRNLPGFVRFLPVAALFHGQLINVSNIARETGVARTTVQDYLGILEDTLLCFKLPAYEAKLRVRERKLPKLYWIDPGIVRAIKNVSGEPAQEEKGSLFEGIIATLLMAYREYRQLFDEIFYWSPISSSVEVDFLIKKGNCFTGIEVKTGKYYNETWARGLRALKNLAGLSRRIIVYPEGETLVTEDGIEVLPFKEFSKLLINRTIF